MQVNKKLLLVLGVALIVRLGFVLFYPQFPVVSDALAYDQEAQYLASGKALLQRDGGAELAKGPVYPMFLAAIYLLVGHQHAAVRIAQAVVSLLAILLIYVIAADVFGRRVGSVASLLAAVYPPFISYSGLLLTEIISVFLLLGFVYSLLRAPRRASFVSWITAGVIAGVLVLLREEMLVLVLLSAVVMWWWQARVLQLVIFLLTAVLTISPWTARNYFVFHKLIVVSPQSGGTLWISSSDKEGPEWNPADPSYRKLIAGLDPVEADKKLRDEAIKRIVTQPLAYLKLCVKRLPKFWLGGHSSTFVHLEDSLVSSLERGEYTKVTVKLTMLAYNMAIILLGFGGIYLAWHLGAAEPLKISLLSVPVFLKAVIHFFLFATLRYQIPIISFLIIFASFTVCMLSRSVAAGHPQEG